MLSFVHLHSDGNLPVSYVKKYVAKKLGLQSENEVMTLLCPSPSPSPSLSICPFKTQILISFRLDLAGGDMAKGRGSVFYTEAAWVGGLVGSDYSSSWEEKRDGWEIRCWVCHGSPLQWFLRLWIILLAIYHHQTINLLWKKHFLRKKEPWRKDCTRVYSFVYFSSLYPYTFQR